MNHDATAHKRLMNLYGLLGVSLLLSVIPYGAAAFFSLLFFLGVLIVGYGMRRSVPQGDLSHIHAVYIIRTIWISGVFALLGAIVAIFVLVSGIDHAALEPCKNTVMDKGQEWLATAGYQEVLPLIEPCVEAFVESNKSVLYSSALIASAPVLAYLAFRFWHGLRAAKERRPPPGLPKSWF